MLINNLPVNCDIHITCLMSVSLAEPRPAFGNVLGLPSLRIEDPEENNYSTCNLQLTIDYYSLKL